MQPTRFRSLHRFDARSLTLFASLTMGGTQAIMAQSIYPASPTPRSVHAPALLAAQSTQSTATLQVRAAAPAASEASSAPAASPLTTDAATVASSATPSAPATTPQQAFARADSNGDGELTRGEAERYPAIAERFTQFDSDRNGKLSAEEFAQALKQH